MTIVGKRREGDVVSIDKKRYGAIWWMNLTVQDNNSRSFWCPLCYSTATIHSLCRSTFLLSPRPFHVPSVSRCRLLVFSKSKALSGERSRMHATGRLERCGSWTACCLDSRRVCVVMRRGRGSSLSWGRGTGGGELSRYRQYIACTARYAIAPYSVYYIEFEHCDVLHWYGR